MKKHNYLISSVFFSVIFPALVAAQVSVSAPAVDTKIASCSDYSTLVLRDAWDMSSASDVNNYIPGDISGINNPQFSNGLFSFTGGALNEATFYLISPRICGSYPVGGRYGVNFPLDTSKYTQLAVRMFVDRVDSGGIKMIWNRDCNYTNQRTLTNFTATKPGWHTYRIDLNQLSLSEGESSNNNPWSSGSITGFAIKPAAVEGAQVEIDWVRLEDPTSCGQTTGTFSAAVENDNTLVSAYLDSDTDPFNGYEAKLATAASIGANQNVSVSASGVAPGEYNVIALLDSDYATLERTDPWDMSESSDLLIVGGVTNQTFTSGGAYTGTTQGANNSSIYFRVGDNGINAAKYNQLSMKLNRDSTAQMFLIWSVAGSQISYSQPIFHDMSEIYQVDLSANPNWTGTITQLILRPSVADGTFFSLDFLSLRAQGFENSRTIGNIQASPGKIIVNDPPRIQILQPDEKGGAAIRPWDMNPGDFALLGNLRDDADPVYPGELLTSFLPDVREVDDRRGDFFKGTNVAGIDDPNNFSVYPAPLPKQDPITFDSAQYPNLCFGMLVDSPFDLCLGSVSRVLWESDVQGAITSDDLVQVRSHWDTHKWLDYCIDMRELAHEGELASGWLGTVSSFRIDAHEFSKDTCGADGIPTGGDISKTYYFDYVKLRQDDKADGQYRLIFDLDDTDDDNATVDFYYSATEALTGGTLIGSAQQGDTGILWDTTGVLNGTYYIYAVASDGTNEDRVLALGRMKVENTGAGQGQPPTLVVDTPSEDLDLCDELQVKGYALESDKFEPVALVEVLVDSQRIATQVPSLYSAAAKLANPTLEASNSGFNIIVGAEWEALSDGAHDVTVRALSTDGQSTEQEFSVIKGDSGCPQRIEDPAPSGTPIPSEILPPSSGAPKFSKAKLLADGTAQFVIKNAHEQGVTCTILMRAGIKQEDLTRAVKRFSSSEPLLKLTAKKAFINKKKVKRLYFQADKRCDGYTVTTSPIKMVRVTAEKGAKNLKAAINRLKKLAPPKAKKKKKA